MGGLLNNTTIGNLLEEPVIFDIFFEFLKTSKIKVVQKIKYMKYKIRNISLNNKKQILLNYHPFDYPL